MLRPVAVAPNISPGRAAQLMAQYREAQVNPGYAQLLTQQLAANEEHTRREQMRSHALLEAALHEEVQVAERKRR